jgi:hypothetical protein
LFVWSGTGIYEIKDDVVSTFFKAVELSDYQPGITIKSTDIISGEEIWLVGKKSVLFHLKNGQWKKYNPPSAIYTKDSWRDIAHDANGNMWFSFSKDPLLRFNGSSWKPVKVNLDPPPVVYRRIFNLSETLSIGIDQDYQMLNPRTSQYLFEKNEAFKSVFCIRQDDQGNQYWSTDKGLYILAGNNWEKTSVNGRIGQSLFYNGALYYGLEKAFYRYQNGKAERLTSNIHFQGWDQITGMGFHQDHLGRMLVWSASRKGVLSIFDGKSWSKRISIGGRGFGQIEDAKSLGDSTYIICKGDRSPAILDGQNWRWLESPAFEGEKIKWVYHCPDDSIWLHTEANKLIIIRNNGITKIDSPVDNTTGRPSRFAGVVKMDTGVYNLYSGKEVIECSLE